MKQNHFAPDPVDLGIVGGGQLARMTIERASKLGLTTMVLDPDANCPAASAADGFIQATFDDALGLQRLVENSQVTTFDVELADAKVLNQLAERGHRIVPDPKILATIQDKLTQRKFFASLGFPVPKFVGVERPTAADVFAFGFPVVQKARRGGYDGKGVVVLPGPSAIRSMLNVPSVFEEYAPIEAEISVVVARSARGEVRRYAPVEMIIDPRLNLIEGSLFPARLDESTTRRAQRLAERAVEALGGVGVFAVELFVGPDDTLWLNEIAPRPHNSGHVTIEASVTCQFEQHVRAVTGMPLGDISLIRPAAMVNLVGTENDSGPIELPGLSSALAVPGACLHLYGKSQIRPGRKMGHITVLDDDPAVALDRARLARGMLGLRSRTAA